MSKTVTAVIKGFDGKRLLIEPTEDITRELMQKSVNDVELRLNDGRSISNDQRRKTFAIIRDIALWSGHDPDEIRAFIEWDFVCKAGIEPFSLSDVDMSTATDFISYLIDFCFRWSVPTRDSLLDRTDDIDRYLYMCLAYRKCAVCNAPADVHHVDRVGMGRDREKIVHVGLRACALCRTHHQEAHDDEQAFFEKYHIYGIKLDEYLCNRLRLNTGRSEKQ